MMTTFMGKHFEPKKKKKKSLILSSNMVFAFNLVHYEMSWLRLNLPFAFLDSTSSSSIVSQNPGFA